VSSLSPELPLAVVGCDFRVASSSWRSRLALGDEEALALAGALRRNRLTDGFVDLNTCNRTEWIVSGRDPHWAASLLRGQMVERAGPDAAGWLSPYAYAGDEAALHVFRVALGRESLVVGERQIAGQLYDALDRARARASSSRVLNGLGAAAGRLVRAAVRSGCVADSSVGVHSLAVSYLRHWSGNRERARVAVAGLGQIGRRVLGLLQREGRFEVIAFNRTVAAGQSGTVRPLAELAGALSRLDAVVLCTGAPHPVLTARDLAAREADHGLLVVDIGVPAQVERANLPSHVTVSGLDELTEIHRRRTAPPAEALRGDPSRLMEKALSEFRAFCNQPAFSQIIDTVQRNHSRLVREQIPEIIAGRLGYLPEDARTRLGEDLRAIVLDYTSDVFRTIRETSAHYGEDPWRAEP
jgi:glutamyl-tRNA reductase